MSKDRNTMAKRQREMEKKRKADDKRTRRKNNKDKGPSPIIVQDPQEDQMSDEQPRAGE